MWFVLFLLDCVQVFIIMYYLLINVCEQVNHLIVYASHGNLSNLFAKEKEKIFFKKV